MKSKIVKISLFLVILLLISFKLADNKKATQPVDYVNPYIGNISHLLVPTFPTIHLPNSMLRVYPERGDNTSDLLHGLPLIVTSHRGSSAFNLSPISTDVTNLQRVKDYSYDNEDIKPYAYQVYLDEENITADFAVSHQSALYKLNFENENEKVLVLNSKNGEVKWNGNAITGYQTIENNTKVFIYLELDKKPIKVYSLLGKDVKEITNESTNTNVVLKFPKNQNNINVGYGISFIDTKQAKSNFEREIKGKSFEEIKNYGRKIWNDALGKITIEGGTSDDKQVFYTSLYRTFERPVCLSEDGRYFSAFDNKVHNDNGKPFYTDDWIWDSYRAHHPLRILIDEEKENNILNSFVLMAEQMDNFWMPTFPEVTGDSRRMNSNHGVASIIDAHRKGLKGFDLEKAYEACKNAITEKTLAPWSGKAAGSLDAFYKEKGYFPALNENEEETVPEVHSFESRQPVAVTLGTSYDEWCLSQIAKELGKQEDYQKFLSNSYNYRNIYNKETKFFHPKNAEGEFISPFDYKFSGGMGARKFYGENNGWIYRWDVQHSIADLIDIMGGKDSFNYELDKTFIEPLGRSKYEFYSRLPDHTGNVGQFSMANEPSLHIPYLYNYSGQPWKTQKRIRTLLNQWFRNDLMGVPGDEDGGGMTSFVVFSQLGFYPVTPGLAMYNIGSPVFENATINLSNGNQFSIVAKNYSPNNKYIQSAKLNGKEWNKPWFSHQELMNGGTLELVMGDKANKNWGTGKENVPPSLD